MLDSRTRTFENSNSQDNQLENQSQTTNTSYDDSIFINENETICDATHISPTATTLQYVNSDPSHTAEIEARLKSSISSKPNTIKDDKQNEFINAQLNNGVLSLKDASKLGPRAKMLFAVYTITIVTIIAMIIMNSNILRSYDAYIDEYNTSLSGIELELSELSSELKSVSSDATIIQKAEEMGMVKK